MVYTLASNQETNNQPLAAVETTTVTKGTPIFKVVVAGEGGVGKTSLIHRYVCQQASIPVMTVGSEFAYQELEIKNQKLGLSIWDFGGEERFRELMPIFCLGAHGAILVFDQNRYSTFLQLDFWIEVIRDTTNQIPVILVGAKSDLEGGPSDEDIKAFCLRHQINAFFPVSATQGTNINELFNHISHLLLDATEEGKLTPAYSLRT